ncbi:selenoprotein t [Anaeramoeba ignava]|uniref:Selenoprotein t n=1 Tax=Anaeramoeba ignava TaxID=1746090 RepID=A0A9Q0LYE8_ANAIG|nr:selenoprotein t [Anaeramoeba ignava]
MKVIITYCGGIFGRYLWVANGLKEKGYTVAPKHGHSGYLFEVHLDDGTLIFSRKKTGRYPEPEELVTLIEKHLESQKEKKEEKEEKEKRKVFPQQTRTESNESRIFTKIQNILLAILQFLKIFLQTLFYEEPDETRPQPRQQPIPQNRRNSFSTLSFFSGGGG